MLLLKLKTSISCFPIDGSQTHPDTRHGLFRHKLSLVCVHGSAFMVMSSHYMGHAASGKWRKGKLRKCFNTTHTFDKGSAKLLTYVPTASHALSHDSELPRALALSPYPLHEASLPIISEILLRIAKKTTQLPWINFKQKSQPIWRI